MSSVIARDTCNAAARCSRDAPHTVLKSPLPRSCDLGEKPCRVVVNAQSVREMCDENTVGHAGIQYTCASPPARCTRKHTKARHANDRPPATLKRSWRSFKPACRSLSILQDKLCAILIYKQTIRYFFPVLIYTSRIAKSWRDKKTKNHIRPFATMEKSSLLGEKKPISRAKVVAVVAGLFCLSDAPPPTWRAARRLFACGSGVLPRHWP